MTELLDQVEPIKGVKRAGPEKGKKSMRWDRDPSILARLESVSVAMLHGARLWQIAESLQYSITTAKKDVARVRILWQREAEGALADNRNRSIAELRQLQTVAWAEWSNHKIVAFLREVREAERMIVDLQGTATPVEMPITTKDGAPLPVRITEVVVTMPAESKPEPETVKQ